MFSSAPALVDAVARLRVGNGVKAAIKRKKGGGKKKGETVYLKLN